MDQYSRQIRGVLKLAVIVTMAIWVVNLPEPESDSILHFRNAIVVLIGVVLAGKILYDTLFNAKRVI